MKRFAYSLLTGVAALGIGCTDPGAPADGDAMEMTDHDVDAAAAEMSHEAEQGHHHTAPHGGHLIELGEHQYNLEVVYPDPEGGTLTLYTLGPHAGEPVMVAASDIEFELDLEGGEEKEIELTAVDEQDGKASKFTAPADALGGIKDIEDMEAHVHITIDGTKFDGELDHDHEGHDHEGHDEDGETSDAVEEVPAESGSAE